MKKITTLVIALLPLLAMAQKEIKPNVGKAEKALQDGKLDDAKAIIDVTTASSEYMVDKKGKPAKNAAESWFVKGVIYMSIDTSKAAKFKALAPDAYTVAIDAFNKEKELDKGATKYYLKDTKSYTEIPNANIFSNFAVNLENESFRIYREKKDPMAAFLKMEQAMYFAESKDTVAVKYAGVYFGPAASEYDKSIVYMNQYIQRGGNDAEGYQQLIAVLLEKKKDNDSGIKVIRQAEAKWPKNEEFPKYELNLYLSEKRYKEASKLVKDGLKTNPTAEAYYRLGQLYDRTNNPDSSIIAFQKAIDLDPTNFDANLEVAKSYFAEGRRIKKMRDGMGMSKTEIEQRKLLLDKQRAEYKISLPYWEKLEKLKPDDEDVLYTLKEIYNTLVMDDQVDRIDKRIKELGLDK
jgi:tetratricopeptide (TPR) repeat protein